MEVQTLRILGYTLSAVAIAFIVASWIFVWYFRKKPIVAMGQPRLLSMICFGTLLVQISIMMEVTVSFQEINPAIDSNKVCRASSWLLTLGLVTVQTMLLCKLYRVHKVTKFRRGQTVLAHHVLWPYFLVLLVFVAMYLLLEIMWPPKFVKVGPYGYCHQADSKASVTWMLGICIIYLVLLIVTLIFAWKLRNMSEEIGESHRIFHLCCFTFGIYLSFVAIMLLVVRANVFGIDEALDGETMPYIIHISHFLSFFFYVMASVGFLVFPRMYYARYESVHGHLPEDVSSQLYGVGRVRVNVSTAATSASAGTEQSTATAEPPQAVATSQTLAEENDKSGEERI